DLSYDIAYFDVTGQTYSSYEDIYNTAAALVADAHNNVTGSGNLILYANAFTITSASGSESVTIGLDTFAVNPHFVETTTIENSKSNETFVYGSGFGQDTITGFLAPTSAGHDHLQFSHTMFGFSSTAKQTADAQALLSKFCVGNRQHHRHGPPRRYAHPQRRHHRHPPSQPRRLQVHLTAAYGGC